MEWTACPTISSATWRRSSAPERSYWPGDSFGDQIELALKYDGTNLGILASLFHAVDSADIVSYVRSKPIGKYARRLWFLCELLTGETLPIGDLERGNSGCLIAR